jgi:EcoEI R protein C-terminal
MLATLPAAEEKAPYRPFDLICHIAFDKKPLTRRERAENVKKTGRFFRSMEVRPAPSSMPSLKVRRRGCAEH